MSHAQIVKPPLRGEDDAGSLSWYSSAHVDSYPSPVIRTSLVAGETFESVVAKVRQRGLVDIPSTLRELDQDLRDEFTLMRRSGSAQQASDRHPRAILFGQDASLLVGFNACPGHRGFDRLEFIQFREATASFELRQLQFFENRRPKVSDPNPGRCLACHGRDPKPIWLNYPTWNSPLHEAYGRDDDQLTAQQAAYAEFRREAENNARYVQLGGERTETWPYLSQWKGPMTERPNARLGKHLNRMHAQWLAHRLSRRPLVALAYLAYFAHPRKTVATLADFGISFDGADLMDSATAHALKVLVREAGLADVDLHLESRRPLSLADATRNPAAIWPKLRRTSSYWDGDDYLHELVYSTLWHARLDRPKRPRAGMGYLQLREKSRLALPRLLKEIERARCQELLESSGSPGYGPPTTPQEIFFGAIRPLQSARR